MSPRTGMVQVWQSGELGRAWERFSGHRKAAGQPEPRGPGQLLQVRAAK